MAIKSNFPDRLQVRLSSSVELIRASLEPYLAWIEEMVGVPLDQTLTLELEADPGNAVAERLLPGLPLLAGTKARNRSWHSLIEEWTLPSGGSPRIAVSLQRERRPKTAPATRLEPGMAGNSHRPQDGGLAKACRQRESPGGVSAQRTTHTGDIAALADCSPPRRRRPAPDYAAGARQGGATPRNHVRSNSAGRTLRLGHACA